MRRALSLGLVSLMLLSLMSSVAGEDEPLGWVKSAGGFDEDYLAGHVVLSDGSIVVAGDFTSAIMFNDTGLGSGGINGDKHFRSVFNINRHAVAMADATAAEIMRHFIDARVQRAPANALVFI